MSRHVVVAVAVVVVGSLAAAHPASATESSTTRIEPRAFYGATVTIEEGVRVFRPLPVQRHVIINPGGQTPLNLSFEDTRVNATSTSNNYFYGPSVRAPRAVGLGGLGLLPLKKHKFHGHKGGSGGNTGAVSAP